MHSPLGHSTQDLKETERVFLYRNTKEMVTELQKKIFLKNEERTKVPCAFANLTFLSSCLPEQLKDTDFYFVVFCFEGGMVT